MEVIYSSEMLVDFHRINQRNFIQGIPPGPRLCVHFRNIIIFYCEELLRIGTSGGLSWTRQWTFGFHKMLGNSWVAAELAAPPEGLSSISKQGPPYTHSLASRSACTVEDWKAKLRCVVRPAGQLFRLQETRQSVSSTRRSIGRPNCVCMGGLRPLG
jgi:hypothetical protein